MWEPAALVRYSHVIPTEEAKRYPGWEHGAEVERAKSKPGMFFP